MTRQALYVRVRGDKFRPLKISRPTLRQMKARLKIIGRRIKLVESRLKEGATEPAFLKALRSLREGMLGYLANIGKETQGEFPKSSNLRVRTIRLA